MAILLLQGSGLLPNFKTGELVEATKLLNGSFLQSTQEAWKKLEKQDRIFDHSNKTIMLTKYNYLQF